jgi:5-methylcytosine-specific restriction endonuclease McrA
MRTYLFKQNRLIKRAKLARKRSLKLGIKGYFTRRTIENLYAEQRGKCACCGEYLNGKFEVDHIIPLSRGGTNFPENIQLLKPICNKRKAAKIL